MTHSATVQLTGVAPYSQCRQHDTPKLNKELPNDYEERTWRNKMHKNEDGNCVIPCLSFKNAIAEAAKFVSIQIPGKGKSTYTKHFESGILVPDDSLILIPNGDRFVPIKPEDVKANPLYVPSDGVSGSGKRVKKIFPLFPSGWKATVEFLILDDVITHEVFLEHLMQAGQLIGVGSFRVRNKGTFGRFRVESLEWKTYESNLQRPKVIVNGKELAA
jgi:hypothetical protein